MRQERLNNIVGKNPKKIEVPDDLEGAKDEKAQIDVPEGASEHELHEHFRKVDSEKLAAEGWGEPSDDLVVSFDEMRKEIVTEDARVRAKNLDDVEGKKRLHAYERSLQDEEAQTAADSDARKKSERAALDEHVKRISARRKAQTPASAPPQELPNKRLPMKENAYVIAPTEEHRQGEQQEFLRSKAREESHARPEAQSPKREEAPDVEKPQPARTAPDVESPGREGFAEEVLQRKSGESMIISAAEKFRNSPLGLKLSSALNSRKLRVMTDRVGHIEHDLNESEASLRAAEVSRRLHKERFEKLVAQSHEGKGLRAAKEIPESARRKFEDEQRALHEREAGIKSRVERLRTSLAESKEYHGELKQSGLDILKRASDRAEKLIEPETARWAEIINKQTEAQESMKRFESIAVEAEARLAKAQIDLDAAGSEAERMVLKEWLRKDRLLVERLRGDRGGKNGRAGIEGWRMLIQSHKDSAAESRRRIDEHQQFVQQLKQAYEESLVPEPRLAAAEAARSNEPQAAAEPSPEANQARARERAPKPERTGAEEPSAESPEPKAEAQEKPKEEGSNAKAEKKSKKEAPHADTAATDKSKRERAKAAESPLERESNRYADAWNSRYGSKMKVEARGLQRLMPKDREPSRAEMESILYTYLTMRPWGGWKWFAPALPGLFSTVVHNRIRAMRDVM